MQEVADWINTNQGFIMILLTLSYVMTTILLLTSNRKLRKQNLLLELLERRLVIYTTVNLFTEKILHDSDCTNEELQQYRRNTREVRILFKKDAVDYVDMIFNQGVSLRAVNCDLAVFGGDRSSLNARRDEIIDWFYQQINKPVSVFDKYIDINKIGF